MFINLAPSTFIPFSFAIYTFNALFEAASKVDLSSLVFPFTLNTAISASLPLDIFSFPFIVFPITVS